jgi:hypothetical protein
MINQVFEKGLGTKKRGVQDAGLIQGPISGSGPSGREKLARQCAFATLPHALNGHDGGILEFGLEEGEGVPSSEVRHPSKNNHPIKDKQCQKLEGYF